MYIRKVLEFIQMNLAEDLSLTSRKGWRKMFEQSNFTVKEGGAINTGIYFLIEKLPDTRKLCGRF